MNHRLEESTPVTAHELASRLGISLRRFYRTRDRLHVIKGLPRPLMAGGRLTFHRATIDDYLARTQPLRQNGAADIGPPAHKQQLYLSLESDALDR